MYTLFKETIEKLKYFPIESVLEKSISVKNSRNKSLSSKKSSLNKPPPGRAGIVRGAIVGQRDTMDFISPSAFRLLSLEGDSLYIGGKNNILHEATLPNFEKKQSTLNSQLKERFLFLISVENDNTVEGVYKEKLISRVAYGIT
jgi:hypothetical protein